MKANNTDLTQQQQTLLLATFRNVLKPFVRLLLSHGVTYTLLLEELKRIFVQVADEEFYIEGKRQTDSRITLLTGVHRKDVHRIREESETDVIPKSNFGAQLISRWVGSPRFLDENGQPKPLPRLGSTDEGESFESLVASVSKDFRARPVYDEWLRSGLISLLEDGKVKLNTDAFIPKQDLEEQLFFLSMNVHDHLAAAVHNVNETDEKMMERCVYYDELTLDQIAHLHALAKQNGMKYLKTINQTSLGFKNVQTDTNQPKYRMNSGVYFFYEPMPPHL